MNLDKTFAMAAEFAALWRQEQALKKTRRDLGKKLQAAMKRVRRTSVVVSVHEAVTLMVDAKKCPTKTEITAAFGEAAAEKFWKGLEARVCQFLTVVKTEGAAQAK